MLLTQQQVSSVLNKDNSSKDWTLITTLVWPHAERLVKDFVGYEIEQASFTEWHPDRALSNIRDELVDSTPYDLVGGRAMMYGLLGLNNQTIQLRRLPVRSIQSLYENPSAWDNGATPSFPPDTLLQEGPDFQVDYKESGLCWTGLVFRRTGAWYYAPFAQRTIQVTYTAGFTAAELGGRYARFQRAALIALVANYREFKAWQDDNVTGAEGGATVSETIEGYTRAYHPDAALKNLGLQMKLPVAAMRLLEEDVRMEKYF